MKRILCFLAFSALITGCQISGTVGEVSYQPYDTNASYALNLANQTVLTKPQRHGFDTIESPLSDFTKEDITAMKATLKRGNGGGASLLFGAMNLLSGNLTGIMNVAGGAAAKMAHSNHQAANARIIVELQASEFSSPIEAQKYISDAYRLATVKTFAKVGVISNQSLKSHDGYQVSFLTTHQGVVIPIGQIDYVGINNGERINTHNYSLDGTKGAYYTVGVTRNSTLLQETIIAPPSPIMYSKMVEYWSFSDFYKELTSHLPKGFYVYIPSFIKFGYDGMTYSDRENIVPAIYTEGQEHLFMTEQKIT